MDVDELIQWATVLIGGGIVAIYLVLHNRNRRTRPLPSGPHSFVAWVAPSYFGGRAFALPIGVVVGVDNEGVNIVNAAGDRRVFPFAQTTRIRIGETWTRSPRLVISIWTREKRSPTRFTNSSPDEAFISYCVELYRHTRNRALEFQTGGNSVMAGILLAILVIQALGLTLVSVAFLFLPEERLVSLVTAPAAALWWSGIRWTWKSAPPRPVVQLEELDRTFRGREGWPPGTQ